MIANQKSVSNMDWEGAGIPDAPTAPDSLRQAGLSLNFLNDLLMRTLYVHGVMLGLDLARNVCLPFKVIEESLKFLKDEKCVEVQGGDLMNNGGGEIYVPYAFLAENSIITVYDNSLHQLADARDADRMEDNEATIRRLLNSGTVDARWVKIHRPVVVTGGELELAMLD